MPKLHKRICLIAGLTLLVIALWSACSPWRSYADEYTGRGETYDSSSSSSEALKEESSSSTTEKASTENKSSNDNSTNDVASAVDDAVDEAQSYADRMLNTADQLFDTSRYQELQKTYKAPEIVVKADEAITDNTYMIADSLTRILLSISGLMIIHSVLAVSFDSYYEFWKDKKFNFLLKSVEMTRQKFGGNGNGSSTTTTTTSGADGNKVVSTVTNTAKAVTGPGPMLLYLFVNSIIYIAMMVGIITFIKIGFHLAAIQNFLKIIISFFNWIFNTFRGAMAK